MSFIISTLKCEDCDMDMEVAFGIVGVTQIAAHPTNCPYCGSKELVKINEIEPI